jgi:hypothetical protein
MCPENLHPFWLHLLELSYDLWLFWLVYGHEHIRHINIHDSLYKMMWPWPFDSRHIRHKSVLPLFLRITKDHTITPKDEVKKDEDSPDTSTQKMMYCQTHKHEPLKLFCETCDKLTCRDCQLLEHKDHKYQFLREAITHQRENLQNAVVSLKNKLGN